MLVVAERVAIPVATKERIGEHLGGLAIEFPGFRTAVQNSDPFGAIAEEMELMGGELDLEMSSAFGFVEFDWHPDGRPSSKRIDVTAHHTGVGLTLGDLVMPKQAFWELKGQEVVDAISKIRFGLQQGKIEDDWLHPKIYAADLGAEETLVFAPTMFHKFSSLTPGRRSRNAKGWVPSSVAMR